MRVFHVNINSSPSAVVVCEIAWHTGILSRRTTSQTFFDEPNNWL
jgi:hypothetical protein